MLKKSYITTIVVILLITAGVFAYFIISDMQGNKYKKSEEQKKLAEILPEIKCNFSVDKDAFQKAIESSNLDYCSCIDNEKVKTNCYDRVSDSIYFARAVDQYDVNICDNIKETVQKNSCKKLVASAKQELQQEDPNQLAAIYLNSGNYSEAINVYSSILSNNGENVEILSNLALAYANQALSTHQEEDLIPQALELIEKAISIDSNNAELYRIRGYIYEVKPDLNLALESYEKALEIDPNYVLAYVGRGHTHNLMGILEKALEDYEKAKEIDKNREFVDVYANLCRLQSTRGDLLEKAAENCKIVTESDNVSPVRKSSSYQILADIYLKLGREDEALNQLKMADALSPDDANVYVSYARYYIYKQDWENAQKYSQMAIDKDSIKSVAYGILSYSLYQQSEFNQAITMAQKALELIDEDVSLFVSSKPAEKRNVYLILANIYSQTGDKANENKYKEMADNVFSE